MLGILYFALMLWTGDFLCRRFVRFVSLPHRLAAAFLVGLLASSWFTYLTARIFASTIRPLMWGNFLFIIVAGGAFAWTRRKLMQTEKNQQSEIAASDVEAESLPQEQLVMAAAAAGGVVTSPQISFATATPKMEPTVSNGPVAKIAESQMSNELPALVIDRSSRLDWTLIAVYFVMACWLMFATLNSSDGRLQIAHNQFSD